MPQIIITEKARNDLQRFEQFLNQVAPEKTAEAIYTIYEHFKLLETNPEIGVVEPLAPAFRKLVIPYGKNGYVALYVYDKNNDMVRIETIRHMREFTPDFTRKNC